MSIDEFIEKVNWSIKGHLTDEICLSLEKEYVKLEKENREIDFVSRMRIESGYEIIEKICEGIRYEEEQKCLSKPNI